MPENAKSVAANRPTYLGPLQSLRALAGFSLWGLISFLVGLGVLYVLYDISHFPYWLAVPFSVMCHLAIHYGMTRSFVFTESQRSLEEGFLIFVFIGVLEIIFITGTVALFVEFAMADVYWVRITAGVVAATLGFLANAKYNFNAL